jgi:predicted nucleic acid-binding Zn ribbon protein
VTWSAAAVVEPDAGAAGRPDDGGPQESPHRDTGLDLARSIARSLAGRKPGAGKDRASSRRRRTRPVDPQASGAHPDDRDPQTLDATIGRFISQQGWERDVRVHGVFSRWNAIVGDQVAQHATPVSYVRDPEKDGGDGDGGGDGGGRLVVQTDSTAWATQMRLLAPTVVRRLNEELGAGTVTFIEVRGPSAPRWSHGRRSVRGGRGPRDTYG